LTLSTLLTGSSGLLGYYISKELYNMNYSVSNLCFLNKKSPDFISIDLRDKTKTFELLNSLNPSLIIHTAALVNVDVCQNDMQSAYLSNVKVTRNLVDWVNQKEKKVKLIYFSSDQVYSGDGPHNEIQVNPLNFYGMTKLWSEDIVSTCRESLILRINFVGLGNSYHKGFARWILKSLNEEKEFYGFEDIKFNPLHGSVLAKVLIDSLKENLSGVFNIGSVGGISKADFIIELAKELNLSSAFIRKISYKSINSLTPRPYDMRMNIDNITNMLNFKFPNVEQSINLIAKEIE
tara:strand:+ start:9994 stop:10869 length:876 start_codon:yes stop_codon:yes gene_type:complete